MLIKVEWATVLIKVEWATVLSVDCLFLSVKIYIESWHSLDMILGQAKRWC